MKRTSSLVALAATTATFFAQDAVAAAFDSASNVVLYWGQNSYGASSGKLAQQSLSTYCSNTNLDIIPMAFVTNMTTSKGGAPAVNFANSGYSCTIFPNTSLWDCPTYEQEITTCQQKYGKTILLSIGGAAYHEGGFASKTAAESAADLIWQTFGPVNSSSSAPRTFHGAVVDGFDMDFESTGNYYRAFGLRLRALMNADTSKQYYLTAAPQCPYPDVSMNPMFTDPNGGVPFDAFFVQYYNNDGCGVQTYTAGSASQAKFNFQTWSNFAKSSKSANKNAKVFLGVGGGKTAGSGYQTAAQLKSVINYCKSFSNFGGVMVWDASQAYANQPFLHDVKSTLVAAAKKMRARAWWSEA